MLWDRPFVERVFGFRHVIEVYKPAPQREYGYYVLPFLYGDRLVGRADLKADRAEGVLRVRAFHLEPKVRRSGALETAFDKALDRLARVLGLERRAVIEVSREEARRIAVRAQLLDGSARGVLSTVRRLGFLQIDTVSTVAPPAAPRPLLAARPALRPRRARPPALEGAEALRGGRVHLPDRRPPARARAHAASTRADTRARRGSPPSSRRTPRSAATSSASSSAAARCSRARSRTIRARNARRTAGGANGSWR